MYSFDEEYLFLDELHYKLGDLCKPGDSIRYYHNSSQQYRIIQDEYSFYAALKFYLLPTSRRCVMALYINGSELLS
jgi:hypothetical protein